MQSEGSVRLGFASFRAEQAGRIGGQVTHCQLHFWIPERDAGGTGNDPSDAGRRNKVELLHAFATIHRI